MTDRYVVKARRQIGEREHSRARRGGVELETCTLLLDVNRRVRHRRARLVRHSSGDAPAIGLAQRFRNMEKNAQKTTQNQPSPSLAIHFHGFPPLETSAKNTEVSLRCGNTQINDTSNTSAHQHPNGHG